MIPDPPSTEVPFVAGGEGSPAGRGVSHDAAPAGWIPCAICTGTIPLDEHRSARCWTDPTGITVAAHRACLIRLGEHELRLPPDPGEPT